MIRSHRGWTIYPVVDDETGYIFQYDCHRPSSDPCADEPYFSARTLIDARRRIDAFLTELANDLALHLAFGGIRSDFLDADLIPRRKR